MINVAVAGKRGPAGRRYCRVQPGDRARKIKVGPNRGGVENVSVRERITFRRFQAHILIKQMNKSAGVQISYELLRIAPAGLIVRSATEINVPLNEPANHGTAVIPEVYRPPRWIGAEEADRGIWQRASERWRIIERGLFRWSTQARKRGSAVLHGFLSGRHFDSVAPIRNHL